jgi:hypothetical protein
LSLSKTIALISTFLYLPSALFRGIGRWLNVETVAWGKQRVGLVRRRNTFKVAETLKVFISIGFFTLAKSDASRSQDLEISKDELQMTLAKSFKILSVIFILCTTKFIQRQLMLTTTSTIVATLSTHLQIRRRRIRHHD